MKKIFALILCLMLLCATPLVAFAEEVTEDTTVTEEDIITEEAPAPTPEAPEEVPEQIPEQTPTEGETTDEEQAEHSWTDVKTTVSDAILEWVYDNYDKALVTLFLIMTALYEKVRDKRNYKVMGTLNNNAITVATDGKAFMANALATIERVVEVIIKFTEKIDELLKQYRQTAEDKARLEAELVEFKNYLKTATDANIAFSNELANLIALANIPNYKKEELGSAHVMQVKAIIAAMEKAVSEADNAAKMLLPTTTEEVKEDVGEEV